MKRLLSVIRSGFRPLLLICLNGALFAYAMFQGGFVSWFLFYSVLVISLLSFSVMLFSFCRIKVERLLDRHVLRAGEPLNVELHVRFRIIHPFAYVQINEKIPQSIERAERRSLTGLYFFIWRRTLKHSYIVEQMPRGEHELKNIELVIGDMFGFFEKRTVITIPETVLVYPRIHPLKQWTVHSTSREHGRSLSVRESLLEDLTLASTRRYVPGDRLMSINWKQTARQNELMTKQFDEELKQEGFLVFCHSTIVDEATFEKTVEFSVSLIDFFAKRQLPLGFVATTEEQYIAPSTNRHTYERMLRYFAKVKRDEPTPYSYFGLAKRRQYSVYIFMMTSVEKNVIAEVAELYEHHNEIVICYFQAEEQLSDEVMEQLNAWRRQRIRVYSFLYHETEQKRGDRQWQNEVIY